MPKQGAISRTSQGNPISRNPACIEFAAEQLRHLTYTKARDAIMARWGVGKATAGRDIRAARDLIASELDVAGVRVAEMRRNESLVGVAHFGVVDVCACDESVLGRPTRHPSATRDRRDSDEKSRDLDEVLRGTCTARH